MSSDKNFNPTDIMRQINDLLAKDCSFHLTQHAQDRMQERNIGYPNIKHVLKNGRCADERKQADMVEGSDDLLWIYKISGESLGRGNRHITAITIIPCERGGIKIITVY